MQTTSSSIPGLKGAVSPHVSFCFRKQISWCFLSSWFLLGSSSFSHHHFKIQKWELLLFFLFLLISLLVKAERILNSTISSSLVQQIQPCYYNKKKGVCRRLFRDGFGQDPRNIIISDGSIKTLLFSLFFFVLIF